MAIRLNVTDAVTIRAFSYLLLVYCVLGQFVDPLPESGFDMSENESNAGAPERSVAKALWRKRVNTRKEVKRESTQYTRLAMLGLSGACLLCVIQILSMATLDRCLYIALGAFSVAIPIVTAAGLAQEMLLENRYYGGDIEVIMGFTFMLGGTSAIVGFSSVFWHFHWVCGVGFLLACVIAISVSIFIYASLESAKKEADIRNETETTRES